MYSYDYDNEYSYNYVCGYGNGHGVAGGIWVARGRIGAACGVGSTGRVRVESNAPSVRY